MVNLQVDTSTDNPRPFHTFQQGGKSNNGGYNDWVAKRKKAPQMEKKVLMEHANRLITVISHPRLSTSQWNQARSATEGLAKTLHAYVMTRSRV